MPEIHIQNEFITLGQFLKRTGWIQTGGQAKFAVKELNIRVNGVSEDRRGRKLRPGDLVEIENKSYTVTG